MWPFKSKKSQADQALAVMDNAISEVAAKYRYFSDQLPFTDGLVEKRLMSFMPPMIEGLRASYPVLKNSPDDVVQLYIVIGLVRSGRHTTTEIADALGMEREMLESLSQ